MMMMIRLGKKNQLDDDDQVLAQTEQEKKKLNYKIMPLMSS